MWCFFLYFRFLSVSVLYVLVFISCFFYIFCFVFVFYKKKQTKYIEKTQYKLNKNGTKNAKA